jgi:predicted acylesterase/phospholipase RssA
MKQRPLRHRPRFGVALAGGGPLGAIYEIGVLAALAESLRGLDLNRADVYVGVSAGSIVAAGLANGFTPRELSRLFNESTDAPDRFDPAILLRPALREYLRRLLQLPPLVLETAWDYLTGRDLVGSIERLARALPTGLFDGEQVHRYLERVFARAGRTNDFRKLRGRLYVVAADLDTGESVAFGKPGTDHIPISRAVQASASLPGLFPPVEIEGRHYVDGALRKTLHASIALEHGVDLLLCVNPLVPYTPGAQPARARAHRLERLVEGGLPIVLAQAYRAMIHSRLDTGMERYKSTHPETDILLFHPNRADADMFFTNLFSYSNRQRLCEHAYQMMRRDLWQRRHELGPRLARHGITIDVAGLRDTSRTLVPGVTAGGPLVATRAATAVSELRHTLDDLARWLAHQPGRA